MRINEMLDHLAFLTQKVDIASAKRNPAYIAYAKSPDFKDIVKELEENKFKDEVKRKFSLDVTFTPEEKEIFIQRVSVIGKCLGSKQAGITCQTLFELIHPKIAPRYALLRQKYKNPRLVIDALFDTATINPLCFIDKNELKKETAVHNDAENLSRKPFQEAVINGYLDQWQVQTFEPDLVLLDIQNLLNLRNQPFLNDAQGLLFILRCNAQFARLKKEKEQEGLNSEWLRAWDKLKNKILIHNPQIKELYDALHGKENLKNGALVAWSGALASFDFTQLTSAERKAVLEKTSQAEDLNVLSLKNCADVTTEWLKNLDLSEMRSISLTQCDNVTYETVAYLLANAPRLEELFVDNRTLAKLHYKKADKLSVKVLRDCAKGTELALSNVTVQEHDINLIELLAKQNPKLNSLNFFKVQLTGDDILVLASIRTLTSIRIEESNLTDPMLNLFVRNPHIQKLVVSKNPLTLKSLKGIKDLKNIKELDLYKIDLGDAITELSLEQSCIEVLNLRECGISNSGAQNIAKIKTLKKVYLTGNNIGDDGARIFSTHPTLTDIDLRKNVVGDGIAPISQQTLDAINKQITENKSRSEQ